MKQVTINIPNQKFAFFLELLKNLGLQEIDVKDSDQESALLRDIETSLREVKQIQEGKVQGISAEELLREL